MKYYTVILLFMLYLFGSIICMAGFSEAILVNGFTYIIPIWVRVLMIFFSGVLLSIVFRYVQKKEG